LDGAESIRVETPKVKERYPLNIWRKKKVWETHNKFTIRSAIVKN